MNNSTEQYNKKEEADREVEKMVEEWDMVRCEICGKKISMLNSKILKNGEGFICEGKH